MKLGHGLIIASYENVECVNVLLYNPIRKRVVRSHILLAYVWTNDDDEFLI